MKSGTRLIVVGAAAVLAGAVGTYAFTASSQESGGGFGPPFMRGGGMGGPGMMMGMHQRMMGGGGPQGMGPGMMGPGGSFDPSARLDSLKSELAITAAQEPAWNEYAKTVREAATAMRSAREGVTGAAEKLIAGLDETQKAKARDVLPGIGGGGPGFMRHGGMGPMGR
jgi:hypothetical protein